jgi:iduronate 2-sulfatase
MQVIKLVLSLLLSALPVLSSSPRNLDSTRVDSRDDSSRHNIIHIQIDDLRTEIGAYMHNGNHKIYTPNIDRLASRSVVFDRAYAQQALCNPSRASYMTGRRPDTTKIWNLNDNWRAAHQLWTSLPGMFLANGMKALGVGKTYHDTVQNGVWDAIFEYDSWRSWSPEALPYRNPGWTQGVNFAGCPHPGGEPGRWKGNVTVQWCMKETGDVTDFLTINHAVDLLTNAVANDDSFYLAVGLHKPHLPWIAKPKHFDMYPLEDITVAKQQTLEGTNIPEIAFQDCDSPSPYEGLTDDDARIARRAYYAAVTGMDEEIGRLLDAIDESGVADNTAIVLHGDHGWQLGERGEWSKNTNWEPAVRVPFMISVPWFEGTAGTRSDDLVELVDIMPTLAELAGISVPNKKIGDKKNPIEGVSIVNSIKGQRVKEAAFSQYPRSPRDMAEPWAHNSVDHVEADGFLYMGYSVRVDEWRYTEWYPWDGNNTKAVFDEGIYASELYDYRGVVSELIDYDLVENLNVADLEENAEVVTRLNGLLMGQFNKQ